MAHYFRVVLHKNGGGDGHDEAVEEGVAAQFLQAAFGSKLMAEGNLVNRLPTVVQREAGLINPAMTLSIKVVGLRIAATLKTASSSSIKEPSTDSSASML